MVSGKIRGCQWVDLEETRLAAAETLEKELLLGTRE